VAPEGARGLTGGVEMSDPELTASLMQGDPIEGLELAWSSPSLDLAERARVIAALHMRSRMSLEGTARMTGATPAQIQALLELATMEDADLELVSRAQPPAPTWFLFAGADSAAIRAGLDALGAEADASEPALVGVYDAMRAVAGPTTDERIATISGPTLGHLAHKAKEYDVLSAKSRRFLVDIAKRKNTGAGLTEKQLKWLKDVLLELVQSGVVCRNSADDDQGMCDEVLDAMGV